MGSLQLSSTAGQIKPAFFHNNSSTVNLLFQDKKECLILKKLARPCPDTNHHPHGFLWFYIQKFQLLFGHMKNKTIRGIRAGGHKCGVSAIWMFICNKADHLIARSKWVYQNNLGKRHFFSASKLLYGIPNSTIERNVVGQQYIQFPEQFLSPNLSW